MIKNTHFLKSITNSFKIGICLFVLGVCNQLFAQKVYIEGIKVTGNKKTKLSTIFRELTLNEGDSIDIQELESIIKQNKSNLYNTSLFNDVNVIHSLSDKNVILWIDLKERWYIFPQPFFIVEERTFKDWVLKPSFKRVTYGGGIFWQNLTGSKDDLFLGFTLGYSRRFVFSHDRPYLFPKQKLEGSFQFYFQDNYELNYGTKEGILQRHFFRDEVFQKKWTSSFRLTKRLSPIKKLYIQPEFTYINFIDSLRFYNPNFLTHDENKEFYPSLTMGYINDKRDIFTFPLKGQKVFLQARLSGLGIGTSNFMKIDGSFSKHLYLNKKWNYAFGFYASQIIGGNVPFFEKSFLGYSKQMRGYENYVIDGTGIYEFKHEWKFGLIPRKIVHINWLPKKVRDFPFGIYIVAFNEYAYVDDRGKHNLDKTLKQKWLYSGGTGLQIPFIYDSMFRIEASYNHLHKFNWFLDLKLAIR